MPGTKEIRGKIKSFENTKKITKAMEMVAASKMRKAQERMRAARPYADKIRNIVANLGQANPEYSHPFLVKRTPIKRAAVILITTDKGLCGGLNTNVTRIVLNKIRDAQGAGVELCFAAIGNKGLGFLTRLSANVVSQAVGMGDKPQMDKLIGPVKTVMDMYTEGKVDAVYIAYTQFINTMKQEAQLETLLPLGADRLAQSAEEKKAYGWDYLYEPDAQAVIDGLLTRYVEALIYQCVAENMACEQSARMVAMKAATDNAKNLIGELKLTYNKARQAGITKELSEIVSGAAAV